MDTESRLLLVSLLDKFTPRMATGCPCVAFLIFWFFFSFFPSFQSIFDIHFLAPFFDFLMFDFHFLISFFDFIF